MLQIVDLSKIKIYTYIKKYIFINLLLKILSFLFLIYHQNRQSYQQIRNKLLKPIINNNTYLTS